MDTARNLTRAELAEIRWSETEEPTKVDGGKYLKVQFNPASLKVTYANQVQTSDQSSGSSMQYVGRGSSKMSVELIFDVSGVNADNTQDVRKTTEKVANFMKTTQEGSGENTRFKVSGVRFQWGTFLFDGVIESMDETLELWSEDGRPLRATVSLSLAQPGIHFQILANPNSTPAPVGGAQAQAGIRPMTPAPQGASLQSMVAAAGIKADWKAVAELNGIESPRQLAAGTLVDLNVRAQAGVSVSGTGGAAALVGGSATAMLQGSFGGN
ncbi:MAG: hypothetical protein WDZ49_12350 [Litorilinea sp.]